MNSKSDSFISSAERLPPASLRIASSMFYFACSYKRVYDVRFLAVILVEVTRDLNALCSLGGIFNSMLNVKVFDNIEVIKNYSFRCAINLAIFF